MTVSQQRVVEFFAAGVDGDIAKEGASGFIAGFAELEEYFVGATEVAIRQIGNAFLAEIHLHVSAINLDAHPHGFGKGGAVFVHLVDDGAWVNDASLVTHRPHRAGHRATQVHVPARACRINGAAAIRGDGGV